MVRGSNEPADMVRSIPNGREGHMRRSGRPHRSHRHRRVLDNGMNPQGLNDITVNECDVNLASIADVLNQELREAHSHLHIDPTPEAIKCGIRRLVDVLKKGR